MTETLRKQLVARLKTESVYAVARDSGLDWHTIDRFVASEEHGLRSGQLDVLAKYLKFEVVHNPKMPDYVPPPKEKK